MERITCFELRRCFRRKNLVWILPASQKRKGAIARPFSRFAIENSCQTRSCRRCQPRQVSRAQSLACSAHSSRFYPRSCSPHSPADHTWGPAVMPCPSEFCRSPRTIRALTSPPGFHLACCPRLSGPESLRTLLVTPPRFAVNHTRANSRCGNCANVEIRRNPQTHPLARRRRSV